MRTMRLALLVLVSAVATTQAQSPVEFVDPFIGTSGGGNTFPGALVPWGMVSVSPHNAPGSTSGYIHGEPYFYGLGHTHLSGTGCADYGSILLMVTDGRRAGQSSGLGLHAEDAVPPAPIAPGSVRSHYRNEAASPGYYSVRMDTPGVLIEASATLRSGITRITAAEAGILTVLLNAGTSLGITGGGKVRIKGVPGDDPISGGEPVSVSGYNIGGGMCGELNRQRTYFHARIDRQPVRSGTWIGERTSDASSAADTAQSLGAWLSFEVAAGESIEVRVGISYVSSANARQNLAVEQGSKGFEEIRKEALEAWQERLSTISVKGASREERTIFYTALYHTMIHPNVMEDVNGEYPRMGGHGIGVVEGRHRYSVYSLWDTYRTLHPLLALLFPDVQGNIVQTMVDMYDESGWLPKWELGANETYLMVGDPAAIVISDTYTKGVRNFDAEKALQAIIKASTVSPGAGAPLIRPGYDDLVSAGYIPVDQDTTEAWWVWGPVSTMLEYNLADAAAAIMADSLGRYGAAAELRKRSLYYRNLLDPDTGFLRPKRRDGTWLSPFDPLATEGSGSWSGSGGPGYVEGSAWNYTWFVPHDVEGLAELFGGKDAMLDKLEECFANGTFDATNEPDIGYPYTFAALGSRVHRTRELVRGIMKRDFTAGASGLPGNDDAGAISAWYVFSALGFYPFFPGSAEYVLGIPAFDEATISLPQKSGEPRTFAVARSDRQGLDSVTFNGKALGNSISHEALTSGGRLVFGSPAR